MKYFYKENIIPYITCIMICLFILAPLLIIGIYDRPQIDDFSYTILTHKAAINGEGFWGILVAAWETNISFYNSWQGLYSSAFILALQPGLINERMYALTPIIIMALGYIFTLLSVHLLNKMYLRKSFFFSMTAALVLLTLLMIWLPSTTEGLYWYNGAMNYMPWVFTNFFNIFLLLYLKDKPLSRQKKIILTFSVILSFLTSGANHVTAFANILFLLALFIYFRRKYLLLPFVAACIGFAIMYVAPGTAIRAAYFRESTVMETIIDVIFKMVSVLNEWINLQWIFSLVVITPIAFVIACKNKEKFSGRLFIFTFFISIIVLCGMFSVPRYAMGGFGNPRVTNVIWITFTVLSWINYTLFLGFLMRKNIIRDKKFSPKSAQIIATSLVCFGILLTTIHENSNPVKTAMELRNGNAKAYCAEMDSRFEIYKDKTLTEAQIKPLKTKSILFLGDIGKNPNIWPNTSLSEYYEKKIYIVP